MYTFLYKHVSVFFFYIHETLSHDGNVMKLSVKYIDYVITTYHMTINDN